MQATLFVLVAGLAAALATGADAAPRFEPALAARVAALDCNALSTDDVANVLARAPAPRIVALQGSVPIVTMEPFTAFLEAMGYPRERLVNPADGRGTYSSYVDSRRLAGEIAWHYEHDALVPLLVGHSQGGMVVVKVLHDLAGTRDRSPIPVWNPLRDQPEPRTFVVDPFTGAHRDVHDLVVPFAAAIATGSLPRLLLGQWGILPLLRDVPDSVARFLGMAIPWDPIAGTFADPPRYHATGKAQVRNVVLPSSYRHIDLPRTDHLARQPGTRAWIEAFAPHRDAPLPEGEDVDNLLLASELWYAVKREWCDGAKRLAGARQAMTSAPPHAAHHAPAGGSAAAHAASVDARP